MMPGREPRYLKLYDDMLCCGDVTVAYLAAWIHSRYEFKGKATQREASRLTVLTYKQVRIRWRAAWDLAQGFRVIHELPLMVKPKRRRRIRRRLRLVRQKKQRL